MIARSPAKINVSLRILGKRENGYHDLEMVNLPLDLHDIIEISELSTYQDSYITCDGLSLADLEDNLCKKAFDLLKQRCGFKGNYCIHIHKEIPFEAGLGGGSSNAATVLLSLNKKLRLGLSENELMELGLKIGSDVPFFVRCKPAKATGIGEILEPIEIKKSYLALLIKPKAGLSTAKVYSICDSFPRVRVDTEGVIRGFRLGDDELIAKSIGNDLMPAAESLCPEVGEIYSRLLAEGFSIASMTGSGSTLFALTTDAKKAKEAFHDFDKAGYSVFVCKVIR